MVEISPFFHVLIAMTRAIRIKFPVVEPLNKRLLLCCLISLDDGSQKSNFYIMSCDTTTQSGQANAMMSSEVLYVHL